MLARNAVFSSWSSPLSPFPIFPTLRAQQWKQPTTEWGAPGREVSLWCPLLFMAPRWCCWRLDELPHCQAVTTPLHGSTSRVPREGWGPWTSLPSWPVCREGNSQFSADVLLKSPQLNHRTCLNFVLLLEMKKEVVEERMELKANQGKKNIWNSCVLESKPARHGFYLQ